MSYLYQMFIEIAIIQQKKKEGEKKEEIYKRTKFNRQIKKRIGRLKRKKTYLFCS